MKFKTAFFIVFTALFISYYFHHATLSRRAKITLKLSGQGLVSRSHDLVKTEFNLAYEIMPFIIIQVSEIIDVIDYSLIKLSLFKMILHLK